jgi:hypothetical protein
MQSGKRVRAGRKPQGFAKSYGIKKRSETKPSDSTTQEIIMQTTTVTSNTAVSAATPFWKSSNGRALIGGAVVALFCTVGVSINARGTSQVVTALSVAGIEGNAIVEFDSPAHSAMHPHYRVDCSPAGSKVSAVSSNSTFSPVIVAGLEAGQKYDCRASLTADAGTIQTVRTHVVGQE